MESPRIRPAPMTLVFGVDVEEEGLFSGSYPRIPPGVENVEALRRLEFVTSEFGLPLTFFISHCAAVAPSCRDVITYFVERLGAEAGAHLHPWSTPPFEDLGLPEPVRSERMPPLLLRAKLETLLVSIEKNLGVFPISFRMGRFDFGKAACRALVDSGIRVDSSIVPTRNLPGGPDHFLAPSDPFILKNAKHSDGSRILEAPLTVVPLAPFLPGVAYGIASRLSESHRDRLFAGFRYLAATGINPVWYPLESMKLAVRLHRSRGGRVLNLFLHSSELKPGATPNFKTKKSVDALIRKIRRFLKWLVETGEVTGSTLSDLQGREPQDLISWGF